MKEEYDADEMRAFDDLPESLDSFNAQVASFYVDTECPEQWLAFDEAIFEALWVDGRNVGDVNVVSDIADNTGLDGDESRTAVADEQLRDRLREQFAEIQEDGVTGVPTFVYDGYGTRGAVPPAQLALLIEGT